ncbi:MAG: hypothetical protein NTX22_17410 [Ignavibacteriales bacterium]|nr:hypothetical protein [Ignavibacteriales bacterium]
MKIILLSTFIFVIFLFPLHSFAEVDSLIVKSDSSLLHLKNAVQFHLVNQIAFSYKLIMSERFWLRFKADISGAIEKKDENSEWIEEDEQKGMSLSTSTSDKKEFSISFQSFYSPFQSSLIQFYLGLGPILAYSYSKTKSESKYIDLNTNYFRYSTPSTYTTNIYSFGIALTGGLEFFIYNKLSLFSEYTIQFLYKREKNNTDYKPGYLSNSTNDTYTLNLSKVLIGISIYF